MGGSQLHLENHCCYGDLNHSQNWAEKQDYGLSLLNNTFMKRQFFEMFDKQMPALLNSSKY